MTGCTKLTASMYTALVYLPPDPSTGLRNTEAGLIYCFQDSRLRDTAVAKLLIRIPGLAHLIAGRRVSLRRQVARVSLGF